MNLPAKRFALIFSCLTLIPLSLRAAEPDSPPQGFASGEDVKKAILSGKLKIINPFPAIPDSMELVKNIEFGKGGEKSLRLDLYRPKDLKQPVPALIFIHGGGWKSGNKNDYRFYCVKFAELGYVVASISYRFSQEAPFPAAVHDSKCAVRWLRGNAKEWSVDPDKIGVVGGSAGGYLAMMLGYSSDVAELEGKGGNSDVSSRVQAVVNLYGPSDLTTEYGRSHSLVTNFMGKQPYETMPERYRLASPVAHLSQDDAPTLILHGTLDELVPISQSDKLSIKLKLLGIASDYDRLPGWPHTMDLAQEVNDRCRGKMVAFFEKHLPLPE